MKKTILLLLILTSYSSYSQLKEFEIILMGNFHFDSTVNMYQPQFLKIKGDTVKAVLYILKRLETQSSALYEAENVLQYITVHGQVTDWKNFYKAVDRYRKIKDYNHVMQQPLKRIKR